MLERPRCLPQEASATIMLSGRISTSNIYRHFILRPFMSLPSLPLEATILSRSVLRLPVNLPSMLGPIIYRLARLDEPAPITSFIAAIAVRSRGGVMMSDERARRFHECSPRGAR